MNLATARTGLLFTAPYQLAVETDVLPPPAPDQLLVQTHLSAISAGTELLFYRGQVPESMRIDDTIGVLAGAVQYPLKYGYTLVGTVSAVGDAVEPTWLGRRVFAFQPHASHFLATPAELIPIPDDVTFEQALFLPTMETAVNFVQDGEPVLGERVVVLGQGVIGLVTTQILAQFPLATLLTVDNFSLRQERSRQVGAHQVYDTASVAQLTGIDADLVYELTGNPVALNTALALTGFDGRIVIGSWYGRKQAAIDLGGHFHRSRIRLISSQVSTIASQYQGRWTKARRFAMTWQLLRSLDPALLITHRFPITAAADAYALLDQQPATALQVLFTYEP